MKNNITKFANITKLLQKSCILYTRNRARLISNQMVGNYVSIYNGKEYLTLILVQPYMVGRRLGEFASTRIFHIYRNKKKKIKTKSKSVKSNA